MKESVTEVFVEQPPATPGQPKTKSKLCQIISLKKSSILVSYITDAAQFFPLCVVSRWCDKEGEVGVGSLSLPVIKEGHGEFLHKLLPLPLPDPAADLLTEVSLCQAHGQGESASG